MDQFQAYGRFQAIRQGYPELLGFITSGDGRLDADKLNTVLRQLGIVPEAHTLLGRLTAFKTWAESITLLKQRYPLVYAQVTNQGRDYSYGALRRALRQFGVVTTPGGNALQDMDNLLEYLGVTGREDLSSRKRGRGTYGYDELALTYETLPRTERQIREAYKQMLADTEWLNENE